MSTGQRANDDVVSEMNDEIRQHFLVEGDVEPSDSTKELEAISPLTHVDARGKAKMVDVSSKSPTRRSATASTWLTIGKDHNVTEEETVATQLAGIRAAKLTSLMIPLCHPINLSSVDVHLSPLIHQDSFHQRLLVSATATSSGQTGVEMEAMAAATFAALHLLLTTSALAHRSRISGVVLESKTGGKIGSYSRERPGYDHSAMSGGLASPHLSSRSTAVARMSLPAKSWQGLIENNNKKGDVLTVSRIAGLLAIQQDSFILPLLFQPLAMLQPSVSADFSSPMVDLSLDPQPSQSMSDGGHLLITASSLMSPSASRALLLGVLVASLTVYDMCKAASKDIQIEEIKLI